VLDVEITRAINDTKANKTLDLDGITNRVLDIILLVLLPRLRELYSEYLRIGDYSIIFKGSIIVVLRKLGNRDYLIVKNY